MGLVLFSVQFQQNFEEAKRFFKSAGGISGLIDSFVPQIWY